jgi:hypothetical protein
VLLAFSEATPLAVLLAATHPERVWALVIVNGYARLLVDVDYPIKPLVKLMPGPCLSPEGVSRAAGMMIS